MQPGTGALRSIPAPSLRAADNRQARKASMINALELTRRETLLLGGAAFTSCLARNVEAAQDSERHGFSAFGDLKYPPGFKHFDYVNPNAPKGGVFSHVGATRIFNQNLLTFNSLNSFILRGDAAMGIELTFASLMARAEDEPDALYGLAARAVQISSDGLTYRFLMRPGITFHDGSPLTAHDVAFSLKILKDKGHPIAQQLLRDLVGAEAADDATLEVPLGSGPYKVGRFEAGRYIEYERVKDWWGADLPVARGQNNFDIVRYEYYRDREVAFEGFTAKSYLFREEFTSRTWATRYDFPAMRDGRVKRDVIADDTPSGAQGWFFNTRRERLKDKRLREAFIYAFDFEWTNKLIMYGSYQRTHSVFQNSDMMAVGKPSADELALLESFSDKVPDEVFGEPFVQPVSDETGQDRGLLRKASALLQEAGFVIKDGKRVTPQGEPISVEFLLDEPSFQPHHMPFIKNLATLGIEANLRVVDPVQYRKRVDDFDFDLTIQRFAFSSTPGDSLRSYFSSQAAAMKGSQNLAGISDPVIDALIDKIIAADSRESLTMACRVLDRVIRAGRYWVPHWYKASHWLAYWDVFGRPATKPRYARGIPETWWYDRDKAATIDQ